MNKTDSTVNILIVLLFLLCFGGAAVQPYFEARAFNRCTHSNASYFDAVFTQLRATECKR